MTILSTKILLPEQKKYLQKLGYNVIEKDFISIELKNFSLKKKPSLSIFTSQNAVRSVLKNKDVKYVKASKCICVGKKTKMLLEENGFNVLEYFDYAKELSFHLDKYTHKEDIAFFCGNLRRNIIPQALKLQSVDYEEYIVYCTHLTPCEIKDTVDKILFFSPSGVKSYLMKNKIEQQICYCIGETTADSVAKYTNRIVMPKTPTVDDLLKQININ